MKARAMLVGLLVVGLATPTAWSHCQIPCGIYGDDARFTEMAEHVRTIEKSMLKIQELASARKPDYNQLVRWVSNKEAHADKLTEIVTWYFMAQRVKPADPADKDAYGKYVEKLTLLHGMMVAAMKAKQTTDTQYTKQLTELLDKFAHAYGAKTHKH
ncbi:MAG: superoxide dismutase [Candidatus Brocadiae bacterium]|nr:superoxide dismutase [Candidatus Brocadiia bacterium]